MSDGPKDWTKADAYMRQGARNNPLIARIEGAKSYEDLFKIEEEAFNLRQQGHLTAADFGEIQKEVEDQVLVFISDFCARTTNHADLLAELAKVLQLFRPATLVYQKARLIVEERLKSLP